MPRASSRLSRRDSAGFAAAGLGALVLVAACLGNSGAIKQTARSAGPSPTSKPNRLQLGNVAAAVASARPDPRRSTMRLRLSGLEIGKPTRAAWRRGGEGLGGVVVSAEFSAEDGGPLLPGAWSRPLPMAELLPPGDGDAYVTISAGESGRAAGRSASKDVAFEVEQWFDGRVIRALRSVEPEGGTLTLFVPGVGSSGAGRELSTVAELAAARAKSLLEQAGTPPNPLPRQFSVISDLGGFGRGYGYGIRVANRQVMQDELAALRQLGVTGLRAAPDFVLREGLPGQTRFRARVLGPVGYPTPDKRREPAVAGCPFDPGIPARAEQIARGALEQARAENSDEAWVLTRDEIGAVTDLAVEGKAHMATCESCRVGFVRWLKDQGVTPAQVGAPGWAQVRPLPIWNNPDRPWLASEGLRRRAYLTRQFLNVASASMFTSIRDAFGRYNGSPRAADSAQPRAVYAYALRGSNFLTNGSSLDVFEFYRHADNAMVWETSNQDARAWSWDGYLMDVQRVLAERLGLAEGIYIKPHRGAPIQRALSAVARGNTLLYWYTYGPDYWKGDAFSSDPDVLRLTQRAAQLLGAAEPWLYGARVANKPRVAIVKPESTLAWANLGDHPQLQVAALENAKWVYTALQHAHVPVDPLDERFLTELDLASYAAIYVNGSHLTRTSAAALARYVKRGGVLVTSGGGLLRDEVDAPLRALEPVFGVRARQPPVLGCAIDTFNSVQLQALSGCAELDRIQASFAGEPLPLVVGSERLDALPESEVLARYQDGSPAMLRHRFGKGQAFLIGTFAGLEYGAPVLRDGFDMRRDFDAARRSYLLAPIPGLLEDPVECSAALVEPTLLKAANGRGFAVTLTNWAYAAVDSQPEATGKVRHVALQAALDVRLVIRHLPPIERVYSVALARELPFQRTGDGIALTLERLDEADVLRLE